MIPSCDKCSKTFSTKQMRDYHINHNSCKISSENSNFNSNMPILESMEKEMKEMKRMMMLMLKNVEELKTEIKELKSLPKQEKKEVKEEVKEEKKEVIKVVKQEKKEVKQEDDEFFTIKNGINQLGGASKSVCKAVKDVYERTGKIVNPKGFINNPENLKLLFKYVGYVPKNPVEEKEEEKKEEEQEEEEEEEEEEETDDDKEFGEYCDKNQYGYYEIGGLQSETLRTMKKFYNNDSKKKSKKKSPKFGIPDDLLYGEKKTKCVDKMDYLKREFTGVFLNFSGTKANYEKLKFYLEN